MECPFCGAGPLGADPEMPYFDCWMRKEGQERRTHKCLQRQLAQQADQIESLELSLKSFQGHHEAQTKEWEDKFAHQADYIEVLESCLQIALSDDPNLKSDLILIKADLLKRALEAINGLTGFAEYIYDCPITPSYKEEEAKAQALILDLQEVKDE